MKKPAAKTIYTCRSCGKQGDESKFDSYRWSNKTGICSQCADEIEDRPQEPLTETEIYNEKVDEEMHTHH